MNVLTDKLSLSLLELFSVLLPGGIMAIFLNINGWNVFNIDKEKDSWQGTLLMIGIVYFIGYAIYVISSILDKWYNKLKLYAVNKKTEQLSDKILTKNDIQWWARDLILPNVYNTHNLINDIIALKAEKYKDAEPIDAFQWS